MISPNKMIIIREQMKKVIILRVDSDINIICDFLFFYFFVDNKKNIYILNKSQVKKRGRKWQIVKNVILDV